MAHPVFDRRLLIAVGVSATLWLTGCGSSQHAGNTNAAKTGVSKTTTSNAAHRHSRVTPGGTSSSSTTDSTNTAGKVREFNTATVEEIEQAETQKVAVETLSSCLRRHGVKVPPQRLTGENPGFNTKGVNTKTPLFKHCYRVALAAYEAFKQRKASGKH